MRKITILHTVKSVCNSFEQQLAKEIRKGIEVTNILDEFLVTNAKAKGFFAAENKQKLYLDLLSASLEKPDLIVVTCSSLTPYVIELRDSFDIPIITIDERMYANTVLIGSRIAVMATAPTTVEPTVTGIRKAAESAGKVVEVEAFLEEAAMDLLKKGDVKGHDVKLAEKARELKDFDVIVLAQASMASAADLIKGCTGVKVITSPGSCIEDIKEALEKLA